MLTVREVEQRIAESSTRKRQLQDHLKRCQHAMALKEQIETKARIKEVLDAQVQAETDRSILREYERMRLEPIYASESEGIVISPSLVSLLKAHSR
jgi:hypothetical protein